MKKHTIDLIIVIPLNYKNELIRYYINNLDKEHYCNFPEIRNIIKNNNTLFFNQTEFFLTRRIPFYIDFIKNEIMELRYNNEKELEIIKQKVMHSNAISASKTIQQIKKQEIKKDIIKQTEIIDQHCQKIIDRFNRKKY